MAGQIILYNWKAEQEYHDRVFSSDTPRIVSIMERITASPIIGHKWAYYTVPHANVIDTKGLVTHIDLESGVICTDAGEILVRG